MHRVAWLLILLLTVAACGRKARVALPSPSTPTAPSRPSSVPAPSARSAGEIDGIASYYAEPYHGRATANGETFDTNDLTAAHRTMAFNTVVRVTNKDNGKEVDVRINDRGPFVDGRIIDLSRAAAKRIDMVRSGTAPVKLRVIRPGTPGTEISANAVFAVQVGSFESVRTAEQLRSRLERKYPAVSVVSFAGKKTVFRVRVGREPDMLNAQKLADRLKREDSLDAFVVRAN